MADEVEVETGETEDLTQAYLDEDPSVLTEEELQEIAEIFGLSIEKVKSITKQMTKLRRAMREQEQL
jgi:DNA-directed RNA polymerase sigma subunit (sigma70/sigma32)